VEVVSPVLCGEAGLRQVAVVCAWLKSIGAKVNRSCGLHVHVGFPRSQSARLQNLVHTVSNFEEAIYASTGTHSRERGHYCNSVRNHFRGLDARRGQFGCAASSRYHVLNLTNLISGGKPTVEFRAFAGTLSLLKITAAVRMALGLVERALTDRRTAKWEGKRPDGKSPMLRKTGNGYTQLTRLLYHLGWVKGRTSHVYGNVGGAGLPQCDSEVLGLLIEQFAGRMLERVIRTVNMVERSAPLALMGLWSRPSQMVVVRRDNPLHVGESQIGTYFASLPYGLPKSCRAVPDGTALQFTRQGSKLFVEERSVQTQPPIGRGRVEGPPFGVQAEGQRQGNGFTEH
jgi:hypothetical protein